AVHIQEKRMVRSLTRRIDASSSDLRNTARHMKLAATRSSDRRRSSILSVAGRLNALSPLATLSRGYAVARDADGATLSSVRQFEEGKPFELMLRDGSVEAQALRIDPKV
ncbi:MAG: exodeoxyribonuclease VII large subunit, partial [Gemmatimonadales bacterium]